MMRALKAVDAVVLFCEPVEDAGRKQWRFWCPFCLRYHFHDPGVGHRHAVHCGSGSALKDTGYTLRSTDDEERRAGVEARERRGGFEIVRPLKDPAG